MNSNVFFVQIISKSNFRAEINEKLCGIPLAPHSKFRSGIIAGKGVVVVMPPLSVREDGGKEVVPGVDFIIVWSFPDEMSHRIDAPGRMERENVFQKASHEKASPEVVPEILGHKCRQKEAAKEGQLHVMSVLEHDYGILFEPAVIELLAGGGDFRELLEQEPSDVGEEESAARVMWIRNALRVFVVHHVVATPVEDAPLVRNAHAERQEHLQCVGCFVRSMSP